MGGCPNSERREKTRVWDAALLAKLWAGFSSPPLVLLHDGQLRRDGDEYDGIRGAEEGFDAVERVHELVSEVGELSASGMIMIMVVA